MRHAKADVTPNDLEMTKTTQEESLKKCQCKKCGVVFEGERAYCKKCVVSERMKTGFRTFMCAFLPSAILTACAMNGILLGGIPTALLYIPVVISMSSSHKKYRNFIIAQASVSEDTQERGLASPGDSVGSLSSPPPPNEFVSEKVQTISNSPSNDNQFYNAICAAITPAVIGFIKTLNNEITQKQIAELQNELIYFFVNRIADIYRAKEDFANSFVNSVAANMENEVAIFNDRRTAYEEIYSGNYVPAALWLMGAAPGNIPLDIVFLGDMLFFIRKGFTPPNYKQSVPIPIGEIFDDFKEAVWMSEYLKFINAIVVITSKEIAPFVMDESDIISEVEAIPDVETEEVRTSEDDKLITAHNDTKFCRYCGQSITPDSIFCSYCGERLSTAATPRRRRTERNKEATP